MRRAMIAVGLALAGESAALAQTEDPPPPAAAPPARSPVIVVPGPPGPHVEDPRRLPEAPPTVPDLAYDSRLLSSAASAEQFQGKLDGGWTLGAEGRDLYAFQLVDKRDALEGAWRDLQGAPEPAASGVLDRVERVPSGLVIRFTPSGQAPVSVTLGRDLRGELRQGRRQVAVAMRRMSKEPGN
ncbi:MAG TPA: hypothetical protein VJS38_02195 [Phenylobacterium sp.]|uniref:hypothetical protein n=1 Tax=Phenylobacterium sp. TaxID=1871053 RepID=UPI002B45C623|nr:hypothetical protein [Phenylobacterium sp.]HKR86958.1 hypothetical protein [Phenylobacterium sp.]